MALDFLIFKSSVHQSISNSSCLAWFLAVHGYNLDLVRVERGSVLEFEVNVLDDKCPNFVAEPVGIKMTL